MREDPYIGWLKKGLDQNGKTQTGLARALGLHPSAVSKMLDNKRKLSSGEILPAAEYLELPPPDTELRLTPTNLELLPVAGKVAAGVFREVDDLDQSPAEWLSLPPDEQFPFARRFALDVEGESMNDLKPRPILDGDRAICIVFEDIAAEVKIRDGMVVVVERTRDGGHTREWSLKQVQYHTDRVEFCPRSTLKKYKPIVILNDNFADDGTKVEIIGLLRNVISRYTY